MVGAGPFWGRVVFDNHEEVDCYPIYRDPIHDFGILRFDPKAIKYMKVAALTLRPDLAKVGVQIKVVGMYITRCGSLHSSHLLKMHGNIMQFSHLPFFLDS